MGQQDSAKASNTPRKVGDYLSGDCRRAIAHVRRKAGKRVLRFDNLKEDRRLGLSSAVLEELEFYITDTLGVSEHLTLARYRGRG